MSYSSKYSGEQVENLLDEVANGNYATTQYVEEAIANAIILTINTNY